MKENNPELYEEMSEPYEDAETAINALSMFTDAVAETREDMRIAEVLMVAMVYAEGDKNKIIPVVLSLGNDMIVPELAAMLAGYAKEKRDKRLARYAEIGASLAKAPAQAEEGSDPPPEPVERHSEPLSAEQEHVREELNWLLGSDTGQSSKTIFAVLSTTEHKPKDAFGYSVPFDPDDFGRCYRLLERFPRWRGRLGEVATAFPEWEPLVREWESLETMYRSGDAKSLHERIQELVMEGRALAAKAREEAGAE